MSAIDDLHQHEHALEEISESEAPDAPVARLALAVLREEEIDQSDLDALHEEGDAGGD